MILTMPNHQFDRRSANLSGALDESFRLLKWDDIVGIAVDD
jgi:hypothetical protein